jgi:hypothetical protein
MVIWLYAILRMHHLEYMFSKEQKKITLKQMEDGMQCIHVLVWRTCWTNMRTKVKRTRIENLDKNPDAFIALNTECDLIRLNM